MNQYDVMTREEMINSWSDDALKSTASTGMGIQEGEKKMESIKTAAQNYKQQVTKNISELPEVNIETMQLEDREAMDNENKPFSYKVVVVNGEEYRVPGSVIGSIKGILDKKPTLKRISVSKTGSGMQTRYMVIPLD